MLTLLPLLDIFVVFMVCIRLVKSLFDPCLVISYSFFHFLSTPTLVCVTIIIIVWAFLFYPLNVAIAMIRWLRIEQVIEVYLQHKKYNNLQHKIIQ